jgi:hypothetical protein
VITLRLARGAQAQVTVSNELLAAPVAILSDLEGRARAAAVAVHAAARGRFGASLAVWDSARAAHIAALRLQPNRPDAVAKLADLNVHVAARGGEVRAASGSLGTVSYVHHRVRCRCDPRSWPRSAPRFTSRWAFSCAYFLLSLRRRRERQWISRAPCCRTTWMRAVDAAIHTGN